MYSNRGFDNYYSTSSRGGNNSSRRYSSNRGSSSTPGRDILKDLALANASTLRKPVVRTSDEPDVACSNVTYVASYNWVQSKEPTVLVPGKCPYIPQRLVD